MSAIIGVSNNIPPQVVAPVKADTASVVTPAKTEAIPNPPYVVDLSGSALAKSMKLQGQTTAQISVAMGLDVKTIDNYLRVKPEELTLIPAPSQASSTPVSLAPSTLATSTTAQKAPEKLSTTGAAQIVPPEVTPHQRAASGNLGIPSASGIPEVPSAMSPPASFSSQGSAGKSAPSAVKALGI